MSSVSNGGNTPTSLFPQMSCMCLCGSHGSSSSPQGFNREPRCDCVAHRNRDEGSPRRYRRARWDLDLRADRRDRGSPRAHRPRHPHLDARSSKRWGTAYRYGLKGRSPRRSEGTRCRWFRTDQFADVQFELVLQDPRLTGRVSCRIHPGGHPGLCSASTTQGEVVTSS